MQVTVIIPCYQEEKYIAQCLDSLINGKFDFIQTNSEILILDGMSTDSTANIVKSYSDKYGYIKLLTNEKRYPPFALNKGIKHSKADVIVRLDAHCIYPENYISEFVKYIDKTDAANIGGSWDTLPGQNTAKARAIVSVMTHPLGMGAGTYRTLKGKKPIEVDTVPFGCWKKEVFDEVGLFDTDFLRDQDYEHNVRIRKSGKKIILLPWVRIKYFARENFSKIRRMFFQYGYWRPKLNKKHGQITNLRQLAPPLWVLGLIFTTLAAPFHIITLYIWLIYISLWIMPVLLVSLKQSIISKDGIKIFPYVLFAFFIIHFSYGIGYISGLIDVYIKRKKNISGIKVNATR